MLDWGMAVAVCGSVLLLLVFRVQGKIFAVLSHDCVAQVCRHAGFGESFLSVVHILYT